IFWAFSIYLEAVAILPQLVLLQPSGNVDNLTGRKALADYANCEAQTDKVIIAGSVAIHRNGSARLL
ncbi:hypothetical protein S245_065979, partial [Arachis hypogaea]